ncbi:magnesium transporter CorA family protein [Rarobacter incanus]|nr:magnesium transporter CorA family protein [Rarobacter incanus]
MRTLSYRAGARDRADFPLTEVPALLADPEVIVWIDLVDPDRPTLAHLQELFNLHPLAVEDVLEQHQRPKLDRYDDQLFLTAYELGPAPAGSNELVRKEIDAFVTAQSLVTVRPGGRFDIAGVMRAWDAHPGLIRHGVGGMVWGLLDAVVDSHFDTVQAMDESVDDLEESVFKEDVNTQQVQRAAYRAHKQIVTLRRLALPMREVVGELLRRSEFVGGAADRQPPAAPSAHKGLGGAEMASPRAAFRRLLGVRQHGGALPASEAEPLAPYFQDVYDHTLRVADWADSLRDMVSTIIDTNMTAQGNRLNLVMKKVTSWAAIIAVPTMITGAYGMNVNYPSFGTSGGFWIAVALIVASSVALYLQFKHRDWL